jgi:hypothetical protein
MFFPTWNKYLPVIKILLKRSENGEQKLEMNKSDFQRAAGGKKVKFTFSVTLVNGRPQNADDCPPLAKDLFAALQGNDVTNKFIRANTIVFTMNNDFQLLIKNNSPAQPESEEDPPANERVIAGGDTSQNASEN